MQISIIIPAYNEKTRLPATLERTRAYVTANYESWEIIVSDDGSTDGTADMVMRDFPHIRLVKAPRNEGKGSAVRRGMLAAKGDLALFSDADLSTPIEELGSLSAVLHDDSLDIVIASRGLPGSKLDVRQSRWREFGGKALNQMIRPLSGLPFHDTQCGFKLFTREAAQAVFALARSNGWAFDVEVLMIASMLGLQVGECPVRWINDTRSKLNPLTAGPQSVIDIIRFRWWRFRGDYAAMFQSPNPH